MQQQAAAKTQQEAAKGVWKCSCGTENTGNFCSNCGSAKPMVWICGKCGTGEQREVFVRTAAARNRKRQENGSAHAGPRIPASSARTAENQDSKRKQNNHPIQQRLRGRRDRIWEVITYKCPNCGGDLTFDPASGKYKMRVLPVLVYTGRSRKGEPESSGSAERGGRCCRCTGSIRCTEGKQYGGNKRGNRAGRSSCLHLSELRR